MYITPVNASVGGSDNHGKTMTGGISKRGSAVLLINLRRGKQEEQESDGELPGMKDFQ